jgi:hypothetical protein
MPVPHEQVTKERLACWADKLKLSNATPMVLLGVGHDRHSGDLVVCTLNEKEINPTALCAFLRGAIKAIEKESF